VITINHCYWEQDREHHCARQAEKEALESYSQKQRKASTSGSAMVFQNKVNSALAALSAKNLSFKSSLFPTPKKQFNTPQIDHKLDSCPKKQITVTPKGRGASATADTLAAASKKPSEK